MRTSKQLDRVLTSVEAEPGITLYTLLDETLVERLEANAQTPNPVPPEMDALFRDQRDASTPSC